MKKFIIIFLLIAVPALSDMSTQKEKEQSDRLQIFINPDAPQKTQTILTNAKNLLFDILPTLDSPWALSSDGDLFTLNRNRVGTFYMTRTYEYAGREIQLESRTSLEKDFSLIRQHQNGLAIELSRNFGHTDLNGGLRTTLFLNNNDWTILGYESLRTNMFALEGYHKKELIGFYMKGRSQDKDVLMRAVENKLDLVLNAETSAEGPNVKILDDTHPPIYVYVADETEELPLIAKKCVGYLRAMMRGDVEEIKELLHPEVFEEFQKKGLMDSSTFKENAKRYNQLDWIELRYTMQTMGMIFIKIDAFKEPYGLEFQNEITFQMYEGEPVIVDMGIK